MRKRIQLCGVTLLATVVLMTTGCQKNRGVDNGTSTEKPAITDAVSNEVLVTENTEVVAINISELEELPGVEWTVVEQAHNIYHGMFGQEESYISLWIDKVSGEAQVIYAGAYHSEKMTFACELLKDGVRYSDDNYYFLLRQQKDESLAGYFYEKGKELVEIHLTLEAINYGVDKEHLYQFGSNDEVESFAQKVLDAVNGYDFDAFSDYIAFPVYVHVNQAMQLIETKEQFKELGEEVIFTDEFISSMAVAYADIMFSNGEDGAMLGDGSYNVWINTDENGKLKVVSINN